MITRLKFEIAPLVTQMLDQLPAEVWTSSTTTFLDPAMAGGQFLVEIQRRLREAGHSDENIAERIWGCETNILRVNYAKNNKKLVSRHLFISDFLNHDWGNMKFDVIIGNPPYQSEKGTGTQPLWPLFVYKSSQLLLDTGHMAMITPNKWCGHTANVIKGGIRLYSDIFKGRLVSCNIQECSKYFPKIGGYENCFSYFIVDNTGSDSFKAVTLDGTFEVNSDQFKFLPLRNLTPIAASILTKLGSKHHFSFKVVPQGFQNQNSGSVVISMAQRLHYKKLAVYWDKNSGITATSKSMVSQNLFHKSSQKKVASVFRSKLFMWIHEMFWNGDNFSTSFYNTLPFVDLNKTWTDQDLYKFFELTNEEILHIETMIE